jgi:hypothetical protein
MYKYFLSFFITVIFVVNSAAYESDDNLKVAIIEKASQFMSLKDKGGTMVIVTVFNNTYGDLFEKVFTSKQINSKNIKIKYINNIDELEDTTILYISNVSSGSLSAILKKVENKNILTVSDMRGFAEKGGILQVYIASQKAKLKINLDVANKEDIKIKASLLRIAEVVQKENL